MPDTPTNSPVSEPRAPYRCYGPLDVPKGGDVIAPRGRTPSRIGSTGLGRSTLRRCCTLLADSQRGESCLQGAAVHPWCEGLNLQAMAGIADKADALPARLSGGQLHCAAIARAPSTGVRASLFDEPTSTRDPEPEQGGDGVIKALAGASRRMLLVTRERKPAADCGDPVAFPHRRMIEAEGPAERPIGNPQRERLRGLLSATAA